MSARRESRGLPYSGEFGFVREKYRTVLRRSSRVSPAVRSPDAVAAEIPSTTRTSSGSCPRRSRVTVSEVSLPLRSSSGDRSTAYPGTVYTTGDVLVFPAARPARMP
jgi:hypothetical protein